MSVNWLNDIKAGDKVVVERMFGSRTISNVHRTTKTMIILVNSNGYEFKYSRQDGNSIPRDTWSGSRLIQCTEETEKKVYKEVKEREDRDRLSSLASSKLSHGQIQAMLDAFDKYNESVK